MKRPASLVQAIAWFASSYWVAIGGYLALYAVAARLLGTAELGEFVIYLTATSVIGQLGLLGAHRAGLREAARTSREDVDGLGQLRGGVRAVSVLSLPACSIVTGAVVLALVDGSFVDRAVVAASVGALVYLSGQQKLVANYLRGLGYVRLSGMIQGRSGGAAVATLQAVLVTLVWVLVPAWGLVGALGAAALGFLIPVAAGSAVLHRHWRAATPPSLLPSLRLVARRDWRFALNQVGGQANASLDVWLSGVLLSPASASLFAAAQRLAQLLQVPTAALQLVFAPAISRLAGSNEIRRLESLVRTGSLLSTTVVASAWVALVVAPTWWMTTVFGDAFDGAGAVLVLLSTGFLVNAISGMSGITLSMAHHEGLVARAQWSVVVVRTAAGLLAMWQFGLIGLAWTSFLSSVLFYAVVWTGAKRRVGVGTHLTLRPDLRQLRSTTG